MQAGLAGAVGAGETPVPVVLWHGMGDRQQTSTSLAGRNWMKKSIIS